MSGPDFFPSAAYASIDAEHGAGAVHIAAAVADAAGNIWLAKEHIPNAPRNNRANWGTFVSRVTTQDD